MVKLDNLGAVFRLNQLWEVLTVIVPVIKWQTNVIESLHLDVGVKLQIFVLRLKLFNLLK